MVRENLDKALVSFCAPLPPFPTRGCEGWGRHGQKMEKATYLGSHVQLISQGRLVLRES